MTLDSSQAERAWALVPAAGAGSRMGAPLPKQYLTLAGRPVLAHTLARLCRHPRVAGVQVMLAPADTHWAGVAEHLDVATRRKLLPIAVGGATRAASVLNGLRALGTQAAPGDWVLVHDAARPCLRRRDLDSLFAALDAGAAGAILGVPVADTIKRVRDGEILETVDRSRLWRAFTPQAFRLEVLLDALQRALDAGIEVTDEASAVEWAGGRPRMVAGHADNIKVTLPEDMALAAQILAGLDEEER